jgi:hypothetical protein
MNAVSYAVQKKPGSKDWSEAFVAVYAGRTPQEANRVLNFAKARFPGATMRRLRVGYSRVVQ